MMTLLLVPQFLLGGYKPSGEDLALLMQAKLPADIDDDGEEE